MIKTFEELFSEEERKIIDLCVKFGNYTEVPSQLDSENFPPMTPEREAALEKYLNEHKKIVVDGDSEVRQEMEVQIAKGELLIDSPEKEAEWQAKIDAELAEKQRKLSGKPVDENEGLSKVEIMERLRERGIEFKPTQAKSELLDLLA